MILPLFARQERYQPDVLFGCRGSIWSIWDEGSVLASRIVCIACEAFGLCGRLPRLHTARTCRAGYGDRLSVGNRARKLRRGMMWPVWSSGWSLTSVALAFWVACYLSGL